MTLLLLGIACSTGLGPEKPDGDGRGARCVPATEIPYDGEDQDCDGADLTDVDGDGADGAEAGGGDCDDDDATVRPGAGEVAYDGIDQDCDGADLTDVDGDGHDATAAGGDDCDDAVATTHPAAGEWEKADGVDNDCDGFIDEVDICPDGSGDELTIQRGVDVVADGGTVLLCPATYAENVTVDKARRFAIVGGGAHPDDVVWGGAVEESTLYVEEAEVAVEWLTMSSLSNMTIEGGTGAKVDVAYVGFSGEVYLSVNSLGAETRLTVTHSRFDGETGMGGEFDDGEVRISSSVFEDGAWIGVRGSSIPEEVARLNRRLAISNNVFRGGESEVRSTYAADGVTLDVVNNTFASTRLQFLHLCSTVHFSAYPNASCFNPVLARNVLADITAIDGDDFLCAALFVGFDADWVTAAEARAETFPEFAHNVLWEVDVETLLLAEFTPYCSDPWFCDHGWTDRDYGDTVMLGSIAADPTFEPGDAGSYTLAPSSPARDIDPSVTDPDGTPADAGAFGGPNGDWWKEYPWPLP